MSSYQQITILGYLGDDPKLIVFDQGQTICNLLVATTEKWKDKNTQEKKSWTEWHHVVLRHQLAELADSYLKKGSKVLITGKMRTRMWEKDGVKRYTTELQADTMRFMSSRSGNGENEKAKQQAKQETPQTNTAKTTEKIETKPESTDDKFVGLAGGDDDLPF
jgi:single-strand DNA-binding protein